jgi:lipoprotein-anchoring transpeptidase ErfK/SrfK
VVVSTLSLAAEILNIWAANSPKAFSQKHYKPLFRRHGSSTFTTVIFLSDRPSSKKFNPDMKSPQSIWPLRQISLTSVLASVFICAGVTVSATSSANAQISAPTASQAVVQTAYSAAYSPEANPDALNNRIVLNLTARRLYLFSQDMMVSSYPVAVGTAETPTPQGEFTVSQMIINPVWESPWTGEVHQPGADSALGLRWIEFASTEAGSFGFHGTPTIDSIGKAASNGCVRMRNEDVVALFAQVTVGTPVVVEP